MACRLSGSLDLDGLSEQDRTSMWKEWLAHERPPRSARFVAEAEDGTVVGFILVGPAGGDADADRGEVYAINVDPEEWGTGTGSNLLAAAIDGLKAAGFSSAVSWVHPHNVRAREFCEARDRRFDDVQREAEIYGVTVPEVRYSRAL